MLVVVVLVNEDREVLDVEQYELPRRPFADHCGNHHKSRHHLPWPRPTDLSLGEKTDGNGDDS